MKQVYPLAKLLIIIFSLHFFGSSLLINAQSRTSANTDITNIAKASYKNSTGEFFEAVSPIVTLKVKAVSAVVVTPDDSENSEIITSNDTILRKFAVCNSGNDADSYSITQISVDSPAQIMSYYFDIDNDGQITSADTPITLNSTQSPTLQIGECIDVLVSINTNDISFGSTLTINLTARSNLTEAINGLAEDQGTIINSVGKSVNFTHPDDPTLIPSKLIEDKSFYVSNVGQV